MMTPGEKPTNTNTNTNTNAEAAPEEEVKTPTPPHSPALPKFSLAGRLPIQLVPSVPHASGAPTQAPPSIKP